MNIISLKFRSPPKEYRFPRDSKLHDSAKYYEQVRVTFMPRKQNPYNTATASMLRHTVNTALTTPVVAATNTDIITQYSDQSPGYTRMYSS